MIADSYNEFLRTKLQELFGEEECFRFMEESEKPRPTVIRTNTLRIRRKDLIKQLNNRGLETQPLDWSNEALVVFKAPVPVGATPEYLCGLYSIQGGSSLLPVLCLDLHLAEQRIDADLKNSAHILTEIKTSETNKDSKTASDTQINQNQDDTVEPQTSVEIKDSKTTPVANTQDIPEQSAQPPIISDLHTCNQSAELHTKAVTKKRKMIKNKDEARPFVVLDMCAAPGGKTTHIATLLGEKGVVYAFDINKDRCKAIQSNLARLGLTNAVVVCQDACDIKTPLFFDRILLDAPCSGTGVISKDPDVKINRSFKDIQKTVSLQKKLISKAFESLKVGGVLVYSTCSVLVDENEAVVDYLIKKNIGAKLVETNLSVGRNGMTRFRGEHFHPTLKLTKRIYPHVHNMDGFFVAKIVKMRK